MRVGLLAEAQDAAPVRAGWAVRFQESLRDRRRMVEATAQDAMGLQYLFTTGAGPSVPLYRGFLGRYQQAMKPPAGKSQTKPPEPEKPGCYEQLVGGPIQLLFCKPWATSTALVFACCKDGGPQPGKVIVPVRKVYIVLNKIVLTRLDSGVELPALAFNMSLDFQSWTWNWTASLHRDAALHLGRDADGDPAQFLVTSMACRSSCAWSAPAVTADSCPRSAGLSPGVALQQSWQSLGQSPCPLAARIRR